MSSEKVSGSVDINACVYKHDIFSDIFFEWCRCLKKFILLNKILSWQNEENSSCPKVKFSRIKDQSTRNILNKFGRKSKGYKFDSSQQLMDLSRNFNCLNNLVTEKKKWCLYVKFKKKVQDSGLLNDLRAKEFYEKPTTKRKRKKSAAKNRWQKELAKQALPKKMY